jgi:hypothetical protein
MKVDIDKDGSVSEDEFAERIKISDYASHITEITQRTLISKNKFINVVFEVWKDHKVNVKYEL